MLADMLGSVLLMFEKEVDYCPMCYHIYDTNDMLFMDGYYYCVDCLKKNKPDELIAMMEKIFSGAEANRENILAIEGMGLGFSIQCKDGRIGHIFIPKHPCYTTEGFYEF